MNTADLSSLLAQAQAMQQQVLTAQEQLVQREVTGTAGGALVRATVTGDGAVVGLQIDPSAIDPSDPEGLADLVLAAIRDAGRAADQLRAEAMGPLAASLAAAGLGGAGLDAAGWDGAAPDGPDQGDPDQGDPDQDGPDQDAAAPDGAASDGSAGNGPGPGGVPGLPSQ